VAHAPSPLLPPPLVELVGALKLSALVTSEDPEAFVPGIVAALVALAPDRFPGPVGSSVVTALLHAARTRTSGTPRRGGRFMGRDLMGEEDCRQLPTLRRGALAGWVLWEGVGRLGAWVATLWS
jgi:hypothetical protein